MSTIRKILVLDGIGGVPLGQEICEAFDELGVDATRIDCLKERKRVFYGVRSAYAKVRNGGVEEDGFYYLPRLLGNDLIEIIKRENPSHILVIGFIYKFYDPKLLRKLADEVGAGLFVYDTDTCNLYGRRREFIFFVENELSVYDKIFSSSLVTTRFFQDVRGLEAIFLPFGAKPINIQVEDKPIDVLFVGSCDLRRIFLLEGIRDHVMVRGNRWSRNFPLISNSLRSRIDDRPVWGEELYKLIAKSKIVLNITRTDFYGAETGINLRIFEALSAGAFLLTDYCDELAQVFRLGEEMETYRSSAELIEKVRVYLEDTEKRDSIAKNGYDSFLSKFTWRSRVESSLLPAMLGP